MSDVDLAGHVTPYADSTNGREINLNLHSVDRNTIMVLEHGDLNFGVQAGTDSQNVWLAQNTTVKDVRLPYKVATRGCQACTRVRRRRRTRRCRLGAGVRARYCISVEYEPFAVIFIFRVNSCRRDDPWDLLAVR